MRYRVPSHVAWVCGEDIGAGAGVYVADVRDGVPLVLKDSAEMIWLVAAEGGDLPDDVAAPDDADRATVAEQVVSFAHHLVTIGLLEEDA